MPAHVSQSVALADLEILSQIEKLMLRLTIPLSDVITYREAAKILSLSESSVRTLAHRKTLRKVSSLPRLDRREVIRYLETMRRRSRTASTIPSDTPLS